MYLCEIIINNIPSLFIAWDSFNLKIVWILFKDPRRNQKIKEREQISIFYYVMSAIAFKVNLDVLRLIYCTQWVSVWMYELYKWRPTFTDRAISTEWVSSRTFTLITPFCIKTGSSMAQQGVSLTLINICQQRSWRKRKQRGETLKEWTGQIICSFSLWVCVWICFQLTHAVLHHHEPALIALKAFTLKAARCVDTSTLTTQVGGNAALINVWNTRKESSLSVTEVFHLY